jgi:hypothetical protein
MTYKGTSSVAHHVIYLLVLSGPKYDSMNYELLPTC